MALSSGADLIDAKDPSAGALGALDPSAVAAIVLAVAGRRPVSATIGDLAADPSLMAAAATEMATTGVDYVKIGFFGDGGTEAAIAALGECELGSARRVAVLMADRAPDMGLIRSLAEHRFAAVMLDTADKSHGSLLDCLTTDALARFVRSARASNLAVGLAGSLRRDQIADVARLGPDIIGFRGALCDGGRTSSLNAAEVAKVRASIDAVAGAQTVRVA